MMTTRERLWMRVMAVLLFLTIYAYGRLTMKEHPDVTFWVSLFIGFCLFALFWPNPPDDKKKK